MMDFACKEFNIHEIIKCGLALTKAELSVFCFFMKNLDKVYTTEELAQELDLNLTTIQKAVKKLTEQEIVGRYQKNLKNGGYIFTYEVNSRKKVRRVLKDLVTNWSNKVVDEIDKF